MNNHFLSTEDNKTWNIKLNKYERDNLLYLLNSIGFPYDNPHRLPELSPLNNGDWVGQIGMKLMKTDGSFVIDRENGDIPNSYRSV